MSVTNLEFWDGHISEALALKIMVLISKSGGGYRGIGLVEVIRKVCMLAVTNRIRNSTTLNDVLHGFRQGR